MKRIVKLVATMICLSLLLQFVAVHAAGVAGESIVDEWTYDNSIMLYVESRDEPYTPADFPEIDAAKVLVVDRWVWGAPPNLQLLIILKSGGLRSGGSRLLCDMAEKLSGNSLVKEIQANDLMPVDLPGKGWLSTSAYSSHFAIILADDAEHNADKKYTAADFPGLEVEATFQRNDGNRSYLDVTLTTPNHYDLCHALDALARDPSVSYVRVYRGIPGIHSARGDVNLDDKLDIGDLLEVRHVIFGNYTPPTARLCHNYWDANYDGQVDIDDILYLRDGIFAGWMWYD